jgi:hypothetical protein
VVFPRLEIESGPIGPGEVSQSSEPPFSTLLPPLAGDLAEGDQPAFLSKAVRKAIMEIGGKGLAAAAAAMTGGAASAQSPQEKPFEIVFGKPFPMIASGSAKGNPLQILFVAAASNPWAQAAKARWAQAA